MNTSSQEQLAALDRVWQTAQGFHSAAKVCATLLLGLYNGRRFPFDLTELRRLDGHNLNDCLAVLRMDARPSAEVHDLLNRLHGVSDMGARFEHLAYNWRMKGAVKKAALPPLERRAA